MTLRLQFELDSQRRRALLEDGEHLLGASAGCDLQVDLPTLSRRHARLRIAGPRIEVEDLQSSNGTWIGQQRLRERTALTAPCALRLGDVAVHIEVADAGDADLAVRFSASPDARADPTEATLPIERGERFGSEQLPQLIEALHSGIGQLDFAQRLGEAALAGLPFVTLEISKADGDSDVLLFRGGDSRTDAPIKFERGDLHARGWPQATLTSDRAQRLLGMLLALLGLVQPRLGERREIEPDAPADLPSDPRMRGIYRRARQVANSELNVLIGGESGSGKEVLAQYLRRHSGRADAPFVALNCAALAEDLIDAELFGIERGVATGVEARAGKFEQAHGGILFLDEIGDMSAATQARILRVLQEGETLRIGGQQLRPARVRVIAASNQDLDALVAQGRFRLDLLHRIADWQIQLPPLRERPADIAQLAARFLDQACRARGVHVRGISRAAMDALLSYGWPGNVRELQREMARVAVFLGSDDVLTAADLGRGIVASPSAGGDLRSQLDAAERRILARALQDANGQITLAAGRLGVSRSTLYRRLAALGLASEAGADERD